MELDIETIIADTQRRVKGISERDRKEFESSNDLNSDDWIDKLINQPTQAQQPVDTTLRHAIVKTDRRIAEQDFRDRFPDSYSSEAEYRTENCVTQSLKKYSRTLTRCIRLVAELEDDVFRSGQKAKNKREQIR